MTYSLEIERLVSYKHKLEAENERLRAALHKIAGIKVVAGDPWRKLNDAPIIARNALSLDEQEG